jgi:hypothetical protein
MISFDRFIENFSMKDLGRRVKVVIAIGVIVCAAAAVGANYLAKKHFSFSIGSVVSSVDKSGLELALSIEHGDISELAGISEVVLDAGQGSKVAATINSINPVRGVAAVHVSGEKIPIAKGSELKVVILESTMWQLLTKR